MSVDKNQMGDKQNKKYSNFLAQFNHLHPNISMYILYTALYTFPDVLTRRICLKSIGSSVNYYFCYSHDIDI